MKLKAKDDYFRNTGQKHIKRNKKMIKPLNFTAKEVLHSLLDKSKTQTIRRSWKECSICNGIGKLEECCPCQKADIENKYTKCSKCAGTGIIEKQPKYKAGDKVPLVWKFEEEGSVIYCCECGKQIKRLDEDHTSSCGMEYETFNKNLGTVIITEVFEIEIGRTKINPTLKSPYWIEGLDSIEDLAKRDGFKSVKKLFKYFNKNYDLSEPRKFWVYRWKRIGDFNA